MNFIYIFTVKQTNKSYIGITKKDPKQRLREHWNEANRCVSHKRTKWHKALIKYGFDDIIISVLETHEDRYEALKAERRLIKTMNSINEGYNTHEGGNGGNTKTAEQLESQRRVFKENNPMTNPQIKSKMISTLSKYQKSDAFKQWLTETRKERSERMRGENNPNFNKKFSVETKLKLSSAQKNRSRESRITKFYKASHLSGVAFSVSSLENICEKMKTYGVSQWTTQQLIAGKTFLNGSGTNWKIEVEKIKK